MKTQRIKTLLLFLSMIPFIGIYAQSIYYVSPHASSGGDGSQSAPFHLSSTYKCNFLGADNKQ